MFQIVIRIDLKSDDREFAVELAQMLQQDVKGFIDDLDGLVDLSGPVKAVVRPAEVQPC